MPYRVLFVCTGNTCRSPMAEGYLRKFIAERMRGRVEVASAGTIAPEGRPASDFARKVAAEDGVDLGGFRSRALEARTVEGADLILAMSAAHREAVLLRVPGAAERTHLLKEFAGTGSGPSASVPDPFGESIEVYRDAYGQIREAILAALPRLERLAEDP